MKKFLLLLVLFLPLLLRGQSEQQRLADYYFQNGELEKAATIYEKLYQQNAGDYFFERYVACLVDLARTTKAKK